MLHTTVTPSRLTRHGLVGKNRRATGDPVASATILAEIGILAKRHLVLCVFMNDAAIETALATVPQRPLDVYRAGVAATLADERRAARAALMKLGVHVVDAPAAKLSVKLIDAYLDIKQRALL